MCVYVYIYMCISTTLTRNRPRHLYLGQADFRSIVCLGVSTPEMASKGRSLFRSYARACCFCDAVWQLWCVAMSALNMLYVYRNTSYIYIYIYIFIHTSLYIHVCIHIYIYMCMHLYQCITYMYRTLCPAEQVHFVHFVPLSTCHQCIVHFVPLSRFGG